MLPRTLYHRRRYLCEYLQQVSLDKVCFSHTPGDIPPVVMAIGELEPFAEIFETQQSVMAEGVCAIVSDSTKLEMLFSENCRDRQEGKRTAEIRL